MVEHREQMPAFGGEALTAKVARLEARIAALESHLGLATVPPTDAATPAPASDPAEPAGSTQPSGPAAAPSDLSVPSLGTALLMFAGAFLLRAVTEGGALPPMVGIVAGSLYGPALLLYARRVARNGQSMKARLFGVAAVLVAYPFVWEAAAKLGLLPAAGAAVVVAVTTGLALAVFLRCGFRLLAWLALVAALVTLCGLYWAAGRPGLFLAVVVALGVVTAWLAYRLDWPGPRWVTASVANLLTLLTVMFAVRPALHASGRPEPDPGLLLPVTLALPVAYLAVFAWSTLRRRRDAGLFEILQSLGSLAVGLVGGGLLLGAGDRSLAGLGIASLALAVAAYALAFALVRQRQGRGLNFFYFAWLGVVLIMAGSGMVIPGTFLAAVWCSLALAAAVSGGRYDRWTLRMHSAAYLLGAAILTGGHLALLDTFVVAAGQPWRHLTGAGAAVVAVAAATYGVLVHSQRDRRLSGWRRLPRFFAAAVVLAGGGCILVPALANMLGPGDGAVVAAVRTSVLATTAIVLAASARRPLFIELGWFVAPILAVTGLKILVEDLRGGTPVTLFIGFAAFGAALIAAPRLMKRDSPTGTESTECDNTSAP